MSLINDALKRAKEAQKQTPPPAPAGEGLQPAESQPSGFRPTSLIVPALIVIMAVTGWYLLRGTPSNTLPRPNASASASASATTASPAAPETASTTDIPVIREVVEARTALQAKAALNEEVKTVVASEPGSSPNQPQSDAPPAEPSGNPSTEPQAAAAPRTEPKAGSVPQASLPQAASEPVSAFASHAADISSLQLQGIHFRLKNPTAMINNRVLKVGDTVNGFRVARIQRNSVFVEGNGASRELLLK